MSQYEGNQMMNGSEVGGMGVTEVFVVEAEEEDEGIGEDVIHKWL